MSRTRLWSWRDASRRETGPRLLRMLLVTALLDVSARRHRRAIAGNRDLVGLIARLGKSPLRVVTQAVVALPMFRTARSQARA
jgi:hypothetical protein